MKKFKALITDYVGSTDWHVWEIDKNEKTLCAIFWGPRARQYAREHAKRLSALTKAEEDEK